MSKSIGVIGVGTYLPPTVRKNDWWPEDLVAKWKARRAAPIPEQGRFVPSTPGARMVEEAMTALKSDPFHGAEERRVMDPSMKASDMELAAAKAAISDAGIDPNEIGLVLCNTVAPDYLVTNNAPLLHHNLGLHPECLAMSTEAGCNAYITQLALAHAMLAAGTIKYALLVQACNVTQLLRQEDPLSAWFGDGCAATILGPVAEGRGILAHAHRTRGEFHRAIVASVSTGHFIDEGKVEMYSADHRAAKVSFLGIADYAAEVADETFAKAGLSPRDVDYYAPHQPTRWFRDVTSRHLGLTKARSVETFAWAGSMFGANIPTGLDIGRKEGLLREGDLVFMFAGGAGLTYSSLLMRWGR